MFTYGTASQKFTSVFNDGKHVGTIRQDRKDGLYFYKPKGVSKTTGQKMRTTAEVKKSIEAE